MEKREILKRLDHTLLKQTATWEQIRTLCEEGMEYKAASVCIPPCYVKKARDYVQERLKICTVIGFPNGNMTTAAKVFETEDAVKNGADEIDMVINLGMVKEQNYEGVLAEIQEIKKACHGKLLKVIIETCLLTEEEKIKLCQVVTRAGADYIKTSTGFSTGGATFADVELMRNHVGKDIKVKAAGGIASVEDAEKFIALGADRLGTSRLISLLEKKIKFFFKKVLTIHDKSVYNSKAVSDTATVERDLSSAGRASALQAEGHRFEPYRSHSFAKMLCGRERWRDSSVG